MYDWKCECPLAEKASILFLQVSKILHRKGSLCCLEGPGEGTPCEERLTKEVGLMIQEADQKQDSSTPLFPAESRPTPNKVGTLN